jgi:hypothetical protein
MSSLKIFLRICEYLTDVDLHNLRSYILENFYIDSKFNDIAKFLVEWYGNSAFSYWAILFPQFNSEYIGIEILHLCNLNYPKKEYIYELESSINYNYLLCLNYILSNCFIDERTKTSALRDVIIRDKLYILKIFNKARLLPIDNDILIIACLYQRHEIATWLINIGYDVNENYPLLYTIDNNDYYLTKYLLEYGADPFIVIPDDMKTIYDSVKQKKDYKMMLFLTLNRKKHYKYAPCISPWLLIRRKSLLSPFYCSRSEQ